MAKSEAIDLTSDEPVLEYIEGQRAPSGVPARDLNGGDLAHITEVELLSAADHHVEDFVRPHATPAKAAKVAQSLIESGAFKAASVPRETKSTTPPAEPVAEPEA